MGRETGGSGHWGTCNSKGKAGLQPADLELTTSDCVFMDAEAAAGCASAKLQLRRCSAGLPAEAAQSMLLLACTAPVQCCRVAANACMLSPLDCKGTGKAGQLKSASMHNDASMHLAVQQAVEASAHAQQAQTAAAAACTHSEHRVHDPRGRTSAAARTQDRTD